MFRDRFESFDGTRISLRSLALALTLAGLTDFAVAGQRKKVKGSRRTTPNKPLAFSLYPLTYLDPPTLPQTSLRDMSVLKTEETPLASLCIEFLYAGCYNPAQTSFPDFSILMDVITQLKFGFSFLLLVLVGGTLGYSLLEEWGPLDALYMTVITITTVGYGEVKPLSQGGVLFTMILILFSVGMVAFIVVGLARIMVEGEIRRIFGRRKLEKKIGGLKDHYIVCGYGRIGSYICSELAERPAPFVVVETDPEVTQRIEDANYHYVHGDATDEQTLTKAGIESAKCLVATVASDADNLYITLTARELNPNLYILSRATDENAQKKLLTAGANKVVSPYLIGAHRMAMALLRPTVVDFMEIAMQRKSIELQMEEIRVDHIGRLPSPTLRDSGIRSDLDLIIVAIKKESGQMMYNPSSEVQIEAGDTLITLGERKNLDKLEKLVLK